MVGQDAASWPQLGMVHKNGERIVGRDMGRVDQYYRAGTPPCNQLLRSSVTGVVRLVRVDDYLDVTFDGTKFWWAARDGEVVGRLTWALSTETRDTSWMDYQIVFPRAGRMLVTRLSLTPQDEIVNCGGIVYPV